MRNQILPTLVAAAVTAAASPAALAAETAELLPSKDNTLIEDPTGSLSLGAAWNFYAGRVGENGGGTRRRAVMHFDIAGAVPKGATITAVTLRLRMVQSSSGGQPVTLHRMLADWGEGASFGFGGAGAAAEPGDATWLHTFYPDLFWTTPGGDYDAAISATRIVGGPAYYTWGSTPAMVADVQGWLDDAAGNNGWILIGDETELQSVKKFESRESTVPEYKPRLTITYELSTFDPADLNEDGVVDGADLGLLLGAWGGKGPGDLNGDGVVDGADLGLLLGAWTA